jgi:hypothetical protein
MFTAVGCAQEQKYNPSSSMTLVDSLSSMVSAGKDTYMLFHRLARWVTAHRQFRWVHLEAQAQHMAGTALT